jgi:hypothetical protein
MPSSTLDGGRVRWVADRHDTDARNQFLAPRAKGWSLGRIAERLQWNMFPRKTLSPLGAAAERNAQGLRGAAAGGEGDCRRRVVMKLHRFCLVFASKSRFHAKTSQPMRPESKGALPNRTHAATADFKPS